MLGCLRCCQRTTRPEAHREDRRGSIAAAADPRWAVNCFAILRVSKQARKRLRVDRETTARRHARRRLRCTLRLRRDYVCETMATARRQRRRDDDDGARRRRRDDGSGGATMARRRRRRWGGPSAAGRVDNGETTSARRRWGARRRRRGASMTSPTRDGSHAGIDLCAGEHRQSSASTAAQQTRRLLLPAGFRTRSV